MNRSGGGRPKEFPFRFPYYDRVADTDHPAYNFTPARYIKCAAFFNGDARIQTKKGMHFDRELHLTDSELNPVKVFSFKNTARILMEHGADPAFVGNAENWVQGFGKNASAVFPAGTPTFTYPPENVFWCHPTEIGLMEQMLPQRSSQSELYSAMLRGENIIEALTMEQQRSRDYNKVMSTAR